MTNDLPTFGKILLENLSDCSDATPSSHLEIFWSSEDSMFCGFHLPDYGSLAELTTNAYDVILKYAAELGFHLQRCWHFIPRINEQEGEIERYQLFCSGRHKALIESGVFKPHELRSASTLGSKGELLSIFVLLGKNKGKCIENPHQVSAYNYPKQYGIDSPAFSRAYHVDNTLFISGTASIKGHLTQHPDNLKKQLRETQLRIDILVESMTPKVLIAYVKHAEDIPEVEEFIQLNYDTAFTNKTIQVDSCREALLVQIELIAQ